MLDRVGGWCHLEFTKFLHFEKCETDDFLGIWKSSKGGDESLVMEKIV